jgi:DNA-binding transcriptional LysR family regulator
LAIGFFWSFSSGPVVKLLRAFMVAYPGVSVRTVEDGNEQLLARIRDNDLDVVLTATEPPPFKRLRSVGAFSTLPLWLEPLRVAVPNDFKGSSLSWADLAEQNLLCQPKDDWRRFVEHLERLGGPTLHFAVQDVSREGLLGLVAAGLGWVIVPASIAHVDLPGLRTVRIASEGAILQVEAIWHPKADNPALTRFLALARQTFDPMD